MEHANEMDRSVDSEHLLVDARSCHMGAKENTEERDDRSSDFEKEVKQVKEGDSDLESTRDSVSSQGETPSIEDTKVKRVSRVPKTIMNKQSRESNPRSSRVSSDRNSSKVQLKASSNGQKTQSKSQRPKRASATPKPINGKKGDNVMVPSKPTSDISEGSDDKTVEEDKEVDVLDDGLNYGQSIRSDDEAGETEDNSPGDDRLSTCQKIEEMELRIEKLEEELREVAVLEVALYSMVPEHGSSAHKVHTPARRLSRVYLHACKHWTQDRRATVARNTVSGFVLVAKSCGNDVPRLTFWLSNTVVLREIISQTFGHVSTSNSIFRIAGSNGDARKTEGNPSSHKWKSNGTVQTKRLDLSQFVDDWQETSTLTVALEKIEAWIFSRIVESVWWQSMTPHMHSPEEDLYASQSFGRLLGPALGDQQQGSFSINVWKSAFHDAFSRLCPVRAGGHECGCLPVLARMVMEHCVSRLDVAMFNAILRESANDTPTDPVSDPIVDAKVLPIPAGDLSFGSGAQLKNSIGNWSRMLTDFFGMDAGDAIIEGEVAGEANGRRGGDADSECFHLLNELSDLLMLPKDLLFDKSIREEVCPSIGLSVVIRILCNFTPDEFCPDPVPGTVLEELNAESLLERRSPEKDLINTFPRPAAIVIYSPPSLDDVAEKVADAGGKAELERRTSIVRRKGYTSDEDLDILDSPLASLIDKVPASSPIKTEPQKESSQANARYKLLREVWSE